MQQQGLGKRSLLLAGEKSSGGGFPRRFWSRRVVFSKTRGKDSSNVTWLRLQEAARNAALRLCSGRSAASPPTPALVHPRGCVSTTPFPRSLARPPAGGVVLHPRGSGSAGCFPASPPERPASAVGRARPSRHCCLYLGLRVKTGEIPGDALPRQALICLQVPRILSVSYYNNVGQISAFPASLAVRKG